MLATPSSMDSYEHHGLRLLDACNVDCMGILPSLGEGPVDPRTFFVGEVDTAPSVDAANAMDSQPLVMPDSKEVLDNGPEVGRWNDAFPAIPEHAELQMLQHGTKQQPFLSSSPMSSIDPYFLSLSDATAASTPSTSSPTAAGAASRLIGFGSRSVSLVPRVTSMPNLHFAGGSGVPGGHGAATLTAPGMTSAGSSGDLRRMAAANRSGAMPRSKSASNVMDVSERVHIPHLEYLTPPHLRKGKGGRQPAADPRLDPRIDAKKARRILANRLSAARSKLKQKSALDAVKQRVEMLRMQRDAIASEIDTFSSACAAQEAEREVLRQQLQAAEEHVAIQRVMGQKLKESGGMMAPHPLPMMMA